MFGHVRSRVALFVVAGVTASAIFSGTAAAQIVDERHCVGPVDQTTDPGVSVPEACVWAYALLEGGAGVGVSIAGVAGAWVEPSMDESGAYDGACVSVTLVAKEHRRCFP